MLVNFPIRSLASTTTVLDSFALGTGEKIVSCCHAVCARYASVGRFDRQNSFRHVHIVKIDYDTFVLTKANENDMVRLNRTVFAAIARAISRHCPFRHFLVLRTNETAANDVAVFATHSQPSLQMQPEHID